MDRLAPRPRVSDCLLTTLPALDLSYYRATNRRRVTTLSAILPVHLILFGTFHHRIPIRATYRQVPVHFR